MLGMPSVTRSGLFGRQAERRADVDLLEVDGGVPGLSAEQSGNLYGTVDKCQ
jgi:hypothetical protein